MGLRRGFWKVTWRNYVTKREDGITYVELTHHGVPKGTMMIDTEMEDEILLHRWRISRGGYAITSLPPDSKPFELHRIFFPAERPLVCDHIDRNKMNNCSANIRHVDNRTNILNCERSDMVAARPKPKKRRPNGRGSIRPNGNGFEVIIRDRYWGYFSTVEEAEKAIDAGIRIIRNERHRPSGTGCIDFIHGAFQVRLRGKYLGRFRSRADAEAAILAHCIANSDRPESDHPN